MTRPQLEIADIFRHHGQQWRETHQGHVSLNQLKVMSAIENCRTQVLGGHLLHCQACEYTHISYNSCRNRHCPKCQTSSAKRWLEARQAQLLPVDYYHLVFTLPKEVANLAYYNKSVMYGLLLKVAAETLLTIGADVKRLGAKLGVTFVLHTWGSTMTHHPHVHGIVPGGGLSADGEHWVSCKSGFFLPVRVLSRLFRRLYLEKLYQAHQQHSLLFFGNDKPLENEELFAQWLTPLRKKEWIVYAKRPFAGPKAVFAYLSRYTHRVAISNSRLVKSDRNNVTFRCKNYRAKASVRYRTMTLDNGEFIRRFLLHTLPSGFHRIRHYGLIANTGCKKNLVKARQLLNVVEVVPENKDLVKEKSIKQEPVFVCPKCGGPMVINEILISQLKPRAPPMKLVN
jgi:rubrerythrin